MINLFNDLPNISFKKTNRNPTIESDSSEFEVPFYKDIEYFSNIDNFVNFVNAVKAMVRGSNEYKKYIAYLKNDLGLRRCQVLSNIEEDEEDRLIDMHHGPILTIFDIIHIMVDHLLNNGKKLTTFMVADMCIQEHFDNNIQVVMLSKTVHEQVHENNIFINFKQGFGDINTFLRKYKDGLSKEQINKISSYIDKSKEYDSFDNGVLKLSGLVTNWSD
jgi:hypothetical protein